MTQHPALNVYNVIRSSLEKDQRVSIDISPELELVPEDFEFRVVNLVNPQPFTKYVTVQYDYLYGYVTTMRLHALQNVTVEVFAKEHCRQGFMVDAPRWLLDGGLPGE